MQGMIKLLIIRGLTPSIHIAPFLPKQNSSDVVLCPGDRLVNCSFVIPSFLWCGRWQWKAFLPRLGSHLLQTAKHAGNQSLKLIEGIGRRFWHRCL
jgi:hypothetical protein